MTLPQFDNTVACFAQYASTHIMLNEMKKLSVPLGHGLGPWRRSDSAAPDEISEVD